MSIDLSTIKNIIFDLGGVLLNIDHEAPIRAFKNLGIEDFDQQYSKAIQGSLFTDLEKGSITPRTFRAEIRKMLHLNVSDEKIDAAWNSILLDFPKQHIALLERLQLQYRIFLLSNINEIHYEYFTKKLSDEYGYKGLAELMEKDYYSHTLGLRKPSLEIYQTVLDRAGIEAGETLFIDDSEVNVESAKQVGLVTYHLQDDESIIEIFSEI